MSDKKKEGGYRSPPVHSQFKKGQSGNPGGRKKGSRNHKVVIRTVMESEVEVSDKGKRRSVSVHEALVMQYAQCGLRGNWKAIEGFLKRYERYDVDQAEVQRELPEDDEHLLDEILQRKADRSSTGRGENEDE